MRSVAIAVAVAFGLAVSNSAGTLQGATFSFGNSQNGFNGAAAALITSGEFQLQLQAGISGTLLNEPQPAGMGINSQAIAGAGESAPELLNLIRSGPLAGAAESLRFSFNQPGVITGINFDGVKDESLEYFVLESASGVRINFFDSAANASVPGAVTSAVAAGVVTGAVQFLLEISSAIDDEARNLEIPFAAGQPFTLTFAALGPEFNPIEIANGARLQGITVVAVPEAATIWLVVAAGICGAARRRR